MNDVISSSLPLIDNVINPSSTSSGEVINTSLTATGDVRSPRCLSEDDRSTLSPSKPPRELMSSFQFHSDGAVMTTRESCRNIDFSEDVVSSSSLLLYEINDVIPEEDATSQRLSPVHGGMLGVDREQRRDNIPPPADENTAILREELAQTVLELNQDNNNIRAVRLEQLNTMQKIDNILNKGMSKNITECVRSSQPLLYAYCCNHTDVAGCERALAAVREVGECLELAKVLIRRAYIDELRSRLLPPIAALPPPGGLTIPPMRHDIQQMSNPNSDRLSAITTKQHTATSTAPSAYITSFRENQTALRWPRCNSKSKVKSPAGSLAVIPMFCQLPPPLSPSTVTPGRPPDKTIWTPLAVVHPSTSPNVIHVEIRDRHVGGRSKAHGGTQAAAVTRL